MFVSYIFKADSAIRLSLLLNWLGMGANKNFMSRFIIRVIIAISYSYITSTSRTSLLLRETKGEAQGQVLITMIPYRCLWYNCFMSHCLWSQTDHKRFLSILLHLITINIQKLFIDLLDGFSRLSLIIRTFNVSQCNNCTLNVSQCNNCTFNVS